MPHKLDNIDHKKILCLSLKCLTVQAVSAKKGLIMYFVNSHGAFAQVFKMFREKHVPKPQMISSILFLPIGDHIEWYI